MPDGDSLHIEVPDHRLLFGARLHARAAACPQAPTSLLTLSNIPVSAVGYVPVAVSAEGVEGIG